MLHKLDAEIKRIDEVDETVSGMFKWNKKVTHERHVHVQCTNAQAEICTQITGSCLVLMHLITTVIHTYENTCV